jgi:polar amino acid transport system ATP-binding protein
MLWKGDYLMLEVKKLKKRFGSNVVLNDISFNVSKGDIISIVGPSGSGKSTLLRCLNLIEKPSSGDIIFEGISLIGKKTDLSLLRQKMGMVFQQFNLFPHLTVIDNITLAPVKLKLMNEVTARKKALELLNTINLKDKAEHYPNELSGGQKQRVAIIRTLIMEPDIILFDEPTSALDPEMIGEVLDLIKKVADTGKTMVIVSHEMNFVKKVSNRVLFIDGGKVIFDGKTKDFFSSENIRIKEFLDKIKK